LEETNSKLNIAISELEKSESTKKQNEKEILDLKKKVDSLQREIDIGKSENNKLIEKIEFQNKEIIIKNNELQRINEGVFIPKEINSFRELEEADKILSSLKIESNTISDVQSQLSVISIKFADYKLSLNTEILKVRESFVEPLPGSQEKNEKEIVENAMKLVSLLQKSKRLTNLEILLKRKKDEYIEKLTAFKNSLGYLV
jgi:hypothetical protein